MAPQNFDPKQLQDFLNLMGQVNTTMQGTLDMLTVHGQQVRDIFEKIADEFGNLNTDAKQFVTHLEDTRQEFAQVAKFANSINLKKVLETQHLDKVQKYFENIARIAEKVRDTKSYAATDRDAAAKTLEVVRKQLEEINKIAAATPAKMHKALDADVAKKFNREIENLEKRLGLVTKKLDEMRHPLMAVGEAMRETFGDVRMFAPFTQAWDKLQNRKARAQITQQRAQENMEKGAAIFQTKIADRKGPMGDLLRGIPLKKSGDVDREFLEGMNRKQRTELRKNAKKVLGMDRGDLEAEVGKLSGYTGAGAGVERKAMANRLMNAAKSLAGKGADIGADVEGIGGIAKGGGSLFAGLGEGAAGGLGKLAEGAGPYLMIAGLLRDGFDSMIDSNQNIFKSIGTSGLFAGRGQGPAGVFQNVRTNLTPMMNLYGQTYESNLKMASAIDKFGVSVRDLGDQGNDLGRNMIGLAGGQVGQGIATTVFGGARLAGLDETQATEQIMKLLQQYHMSLQSTDVFFNKLNADIAASGITSTKYLQIIDEITTQFDHMARGINDVTGTLRVLGHTGTLTSEQIKDAMDSMLTTKAPPEWKAYLTMQAENQGNVASYQKGQQYNVEQQAQNVRGTLKTLLKAQTPGMTDDEAEKLMDSQGVTMDALKDVHDQSGIARAKAMAMNIPQDIGPPAIRQQIGATTEQLRRDKLALAYTNFAMGNKGPGGAVPFAFQPNQGPGTAEFLNMTNLLSTMQMVSGMDQKEAWRTLNINPTDERLIRATPQIAMRLAKTGNTIEQLQAIPTVTGAVASEAVKRAQMGDLEGPEATDIYQQIATSLKIATQGRSPEAVAQDVKAALTDNTKNQATAQQDIAGNFDTMREIFTTHSKLQEYAQKKAEEAGKDTKDDMSKALGEALSKTDTYLEQIKNLLQNEIYGTISDILDVLPGGKSKAYRDRETARNNMGGPDTGGFTAEDHRRRLEEEFGMGADVQGSLSYNINKTKGVVQDLSDDIGRANDELVAVKAKGDPKEIAAAESKVKDLVSRRERIQRTSEALLAMVPRIKGGGKDIGLDVAKSTEGDEGYLAALLASENAYRKTHPAQPYVPNAAKPGEAPQTPGGQSVKGKEGKGGNVSVSTKNDTTITHVKTDPPQHNTDYTKGKEITPDDARRQAAAAAAASHKRTMVSN
jgi:hypothetical protein